MVSSNNTPPPPVEKTQCPTLDHPRCFLNSHLVESQAHPQVGVLLLFSCFRFLFDKASVARIRPWHSVQIAPVFFGYRNIRRQRNVCLLLQPGLVTCVSWRLPPPPAVSGACQSSPKCNVFCLITVKGNTLRLSGQHGFS